MKDKILSLSDTEPKESFLNKYFKKIYILNIKGFKIELLSTFNNSELYLILLQPTTGLQIYLKSIIDQFEIIDLIVSCLELSFDFYHPDEDIVFLIRDRIQKYLYHPYKRKDSFQYPIEEEEFYSFYSTRGKTGKMIKVYIRPFKGQDSNKGLLPFNMARIELTLFRSIIKNLEIPFPVLPENILSLNLQKYIKFCSFDYEKFNRFILNPKRKKDPRRKEIEKQSGLTIKKYCKLIEGQNLLNILEFLKKIEGLQYHGYLIPMENENSILKEALAKKQGYDIPWPS